MENALRVGRDGFVQRRPASRILDVHVHLGVDQDFRGVGAREPVEEGPILGETGQLRRGNSG